MWWGRLFEEGGNVGGGAMCREGRGMGGRVVGRVLGEWGWCGGCGYEERTLEVERVVAGEKGLTLLRGRIRA